MKLAQNVNDKIEFKPELSGSYGMVSAQIITGSANPTDGGVGTGTGWDSARGSLYIATGSARLYVNQGTGGHDAQWVFYDSTT